MTTSVVELLAVADESVSWFEDDRDSGRNPDLWSSDDLKSKKLLTAKDAKKSELRVPCTEKKQNLNHRGHRDHRGLASSGVLTKAFNRRGR